MGHTATSLGRTYQKVFFQNAKAGKDAMSLEEIADYAADAYQPGKERREPAAEA